MGKMNKKYSCKNGGTVSQVQGKFPQITIGEGGVLDIGAFLQPMKYSNIRRMFVKCISYISSPRQNLSFFGTCVNCCIPDLSKSEHSVGLGVANLMSAIHRKFIHIFYTRALLEGNKEGKLTFRNPYIHTYIICT